MSLQSQVAPASTNGVIVTGITLVGAAWDFKAHTLVDLSSDRHGTACCNVAAMLCVCKQLVWCHLPAEVSGPMDALFVRAIPSSDLDIDQELGISGSAAYRPRTDTRLGRVGPGAVLDTPLGDFNSPDAPPSYFGPTGARLHRVFTGSKLFACPVYSSGQRSAEDHVFDVWIPTDKPAQYWTLRGVYAVL